jgi:hypothetical protein
MTHDFPAVTGCTGNHQSQLRAILSKLAAQVEWNLGLGDEIPTSADHESVTGTKEGQGQGRGTAASRCTLPALPLFCLL